MSVNIFKNGKLKKIAGNVRDDDTTDSTVTFTSFDNLNPTTPMNVSLIKSGDTHRRLSEKLSAMAKNTRYLLKMLGTTDISAIADGTVTGAISKISSSFGNGLVNIYQNNTLKGSFTMNQSDDANIYVSDTNTTYGAATQSADGLMSFSDKKKLDGIPLNTQDLINSKQPISTAVKYAGVSYGNSVTFTNCSSGRALIFLGVNGINILNYGSGSISVYKLSGTVSATVTNVSGSNFTSFIVTTDSKMKIDVWYV